MTPKILLVPMLLTLVTLPSCMQPVDNALRARSEARLSHLEASPIAQGACDSVGQYIAKSTATERLAAHPEEQTTYLVVR